VFALALVGVGVAAFLLWLGKRPPRTEAEARAALARLRPDSSELNLIVITLDTTRADRLGCYGFGGVATPNIDALARDGIVFDYATATVPLTFPSHSSIFTGLVPPHHGVRDNGGFFLEDAQVTLAERLREKGFATGAFVAAWVLDRKWGLAQGFDEYADKFDLSKYKVVSLGTVQKPGDEVMDGALAWLETVKQRRFFAWVHLYDPHTPYEAPEPFASRYPGQPYLGEIAYTDKVVGRLLGWLREQRIDERTIVVLTADHGESLGDHGESTHAYFVYDATTHVPFVVRTPWGIRGRRSVQASGIDLMPTVLDLLGLPPQPGIDGRSLAREMLDPAATSTDRVAYSETYFPRYHFGWQHLRAVRSRAYKYIDAPEPELYDLAQDPGETKNIYRGFSARAESLRLRLEELTKQESGKAPERRSLDPETLQRLAALGYVGNVIDVDASAVLPDPKQKLPLFAMMNAAKQLAQDDRLDDGVARMREVLRRDPKIMDAQITLGNWLLRLRKPDEAAEAFKQALALKPDDDIALGNLASVLMAHGKQQDALAALEVFRSALRVNPKNPQSWFQLATLYLDMGRLDEARSSFGDALAANPKMGAALNGLGAIAFQAGDLPKAETMVRQALALEPRLRTGSYNLARIREARGDVAGAEALYRAELQTYADNGRARFNLAQIRRARGDRAGYLDELNDCVAKAQEFGACYFYLAREELDAGRLEPAADLATRGLEAQPRSDTAPLGHFVLADVYSRRGESQKAEAEAAKGRKLEAALRKHPSPRI
jgi:arylsulfatase A-like enzyme/Flp pilus assembly protein TadD